MRALTVERGGGESNDEIALNRTQRSTPPLRVYLQVGGGVITGSDQ